MMMMLMILMFKLIMIMYADDNYDDNNGGGDADDNNDDDDKFHCLLAVGQSQPRNRFVQMVRIIGALRKRSPISYFWKCQPHSCHNILCRKASA